jgi:hypothetical protein
MAGILGQVSWGIVPTDGNNSQLAQLSGDYRENYLKSANDQLRYQVQWFRPTPSLNEGTEPSKNNWDASSSKGDIVNVIFKIYTTTENSIFPNNWDLIGTIRKSRDIANKQYLSGGQPQQHRFTVDISQIVSDQLSYSLVPINKGTWQSYKWGGMNGGITMQDNVIGTSLSSGNPVSDYNVSPNGTFRKLIVQTSYEVINEDGQIISASGNVLVSDSITVINSVNQFESDSVYYQDTFNHGSVPSVSAAIPQRFNSNCPNWYYSAGGSITGNSPVALNKPVRTDEQAEWLYWYVDNISHATQTSKYFAQYMIYGQTYNAGGVVGDDFVLSDFNSSLDLQTTGTYQTFAQPQNRMVVQNVSPDFINNNAYIPANQYLPLTGTIAPITADTYRYRLYLKGIYNLGTTGSPSWQSTRNSASYWYEIDREEENSAYSFVRFHWLNRMGGIDSYTAKKDVMEGLTINREVIERKSRDRTWGQADSYYPHGSGNITSVSDSDYISNTMRGGDIYKGGREVSNVNADRVLSVYTEPLNKSTADWLEEIMTSPNVWIEMDTDATQKNNTQNPYQRPSTKGYIPVIITNSDIETVNQAEGLVKFNIEYTLAHKVQTQRN